jgi:hypothetical protein
MDFVEKDGNTVRGILSGPDILKYQDIRFRIDFLTFTLHEIGRHPEWEISFKHKRPAGILSRPRIAIGKANRRGMHLFLAPTVLTFYSWNTIIEHWLKSTLPGKQNMSEIDFSYKVPYSIVEKPVDRVVEKIVEVETPVVEVKWQTEIKYIERELPFEEALRRENERLYKSLGDWRPSEPEYDMSNVIPLEVISNNDDEYERLLANES